MTVKLCPLHPPPFSITRALLQSAAIVRFLSRKGGLEGTTDADFALSEVRPPHPSPLTAAATCRPALHVAAHAPHLSTDCDVPSYTTSLCTTFRTPIYRVVAGILVANVPSLPELDRRHVFPCCA